MTYKMMLYKLKILISNILIVLFLIQDVRCVQVGVIGSHTKNLTQAIEVFLFLIHYEISENPKKNIYTAPLHTHIQESRTFSVNIKTLYLTICLIM